MNFKRSDFPKDFLFGVASPACQGEEANRDDPRQVGRETLPASTENLAGSAYDPLSKLEQWLDPVSEAGFDGLAFTLSWTRVMPEGRGAASPDGLDYYDRLADALLDRGIRPCATLFHKDLPTALADLGGWRNRDVAGWFADFTEVIMGRVGDRMYSVAPICSTLDVIEPNHRNPGQNITRTTARTMHHLLLAHGQSILSMRGLGMTNLGVMLDVDQAEIATTDDQGERTVGNGSRSHVRYINNALFRKTYPVDEPNKLEQLLPHGWQDDFETIGAPIDWCALNCISSEIADPPDRPEQKTSPELPKLLLHIQQEYSGDLPIYVTDGLQRSLGQRTVEQGTERLNQALGTVQTAMDQGVPVEGFFARSLPGDDKFAENGSFEAIKNALSKVEVLARPMAQPAGRMHEHWNLVADIGGTNTRLGVISNGQLTELRKHPTGNLSQLLTAFHEMRDDIGTDPRAVVAAGAGPVKNGTIRLTNAHLDLSETDIGRATGAQNTFVINDFTAAAWSVAEISSSDVDVLQGSETPPPGTRLVVGPGTGLGVGALLYSEGRYHTVSGEGGHIGLSPRHDDEVEVFRAARSIAPDCFFDDSLVLEAEMFLSGTGLPVLYQAIGLAAGHADTPKRNARDILQDARAQTDPFAVKAAQMFTTHLGAMMGDLAVTLMPLGGVYLVGGVAEKNRWLFRDAFCAAFNAGGRFNELRRSMNLYVSEQAEFGIIGANNFCKNALRDKGI